MLGKAVFDFFSHFSQYEIHGLYRNTLKPNNIKNKNIVNVDVNNENELADCLKKIQPEIIINCAAIVNVDACERDPKSAYMLHSEVVKIISKYSPTTKFIYISTDSIFDGDKGDYNETDIPGPRNSYSKSKYDGELRTSRYFKRHIIIRTNIYGFHVPNKSSLAEWALKELDAGIKISGFDDVYFNPVYVGQLAEIILQLIQIEYNGVINIASQNYISKYSFLVKLAKKFKLNVDLIEKKSIDSVTFKAVRPRNTTLSVHKLKTLLGHVPDVDEGINNFHHDFCANQIKINETN